MNTNTFLNIVKKENVKHLKTNITLRHPGQKVPTNLETIKFLRENYGTGKTFRNMQEWTNYYEILVDNNYYMLVSPDQNKNYLIISGTDLN